MDAYEQECGVLSKKLSAATDKVGDLAARNSKLRTALSDAEGRNELLAAELADKSAMLKRATALMKQSGATVSAESADSDGEDRADYDPTVKFEEHLLSLTARKTKLEQELAEREKAYKLSSELTNGYSFRKALVS